MGLGHPRRRKRWRQPGAEPAPAKPGLLEAECRGGSRGERKLELRDEVGLARRRRPTEAHSCYSLATMRTVDGISLFLLLSACAPRVLEFDPAHDPSKVETSADALPPVLDPQLEARRHFQNPGGMWTPDQLAQHVVTLRELGMQLDPQVLGDTLAFPLGAIVWLGGCTGSFVSDDGLIVTNHHCATAALQFNSSPGHDRLHDGFLAKTRLDEPSNGPAARVFVTRETRDVTKDVRGDIDSIIEPKKRFDLIEQRQKNLVAACEKGRPELRCTVQSFFDGETYMLIQQLELRDIRLVYAPAEGIGNYGGEVDNWRWPRHAGDFAFFRAYVGEGQKPADFDAKNIPYKPKHHLTVAKEPLAPTDLVFVAGYPGRTSRLKTSNEVAEAVDWFYPRRIRFCEEYIALLDRLAKEDKELGTKGRALWRGLSNALTNTRGQLDGLVKDGLAERKKTLESELRKWASEHPEQGPVGASLDDLAGKHATYRAHRDEEAAISEIFAMSTLLTGADAIVHMALERPKVDAERDPSFQERNWKRIAQGQRQAQQSYARRLEHEKLKLALVRAAALPVERRPKDLLALFVPKGDATPEAIDKALSAMFAKTKLEGADVRVALFETAKLEELKKASDPFISIALTMRGKLQGIEDNGEAYIGDTLKSRITYVTALRAKAGGVLAPDANSTLRITYGTVRGYAPKVGAPVNHPFTKLSEMVAKNTKVEPFDAPSGLIEAAKKGPFGPYVDPALGEVPVDFLADLDITGGNSGSPTMNAKGELVGLVFDGNYEAVVSDWLFMPPITRSIHVDVRYPLWIMDKVDGADHLLRELGVEPKLD